ncbi:uncharacterized protein STEHIDRAFT_120871, partial [Stereum hirsutum FP-91666 SS1]|uniref:uncharacterized protein n=1 Tax=Stereum hirsutum (strain FP-91666) TaxID=721885 RepID=UPI000440F596
MHFPSQSAKGADSFLVTRVSAERCTGTRTVQEQLRALEAIQYRFSSTTDLV